MKIIQYISMLVIVFLVGFWLMLSLLTVDIPVGVVGVRLNEYGIVGKRGVVEKDFGPGWHRDLGIIDSWVFFDSTVQTLEMTRESLHGSREGRDDIQVTSADGYRVSVDVTVKYRPMKDKAYKLYQLYGGELKYQEFVRNQAQKSCMGNFGQLETEDFYNPTIRGGKTDEVKKELRATYAENYIELIDVLIRNVEFDPDYEEKIQSKKLADQEVEVNKSLALAAEMAGKTQVIEAETQRLVRNIEKEKEAELVTMEAETDLEIARLKAEAQRYATEKQADADLTQAEKAAEGEKLVRTAEAEGERLRNRALMGSGGDVMAALEAARNLRIGDVSISTIDNDLLNLNEMVEKLGVKAKE